jgi:threonyl-tRNA synthetase
MALLPISEKFNEYAGKVAAELTAAGFRIETNLGNEKIGAKIRQASMQKVPYLLIVGEKEAAAGAVAVRTQAGADQGAIPLADFIARVKSETSSRQLTA